MLLMTQDLDICTCVCPRSPQYPAYLCCLFPCVMRNLGIPAVMLLFPDIIHIMHSIQYSMQYLDHRSQYTVQYVDHRSDSSGEIKCSLTNRKMFPWIISHYRLLLVYYYYYQLIVEYDL